MPERVAPIVPKRVVVFDKDAEWLCGELRAALPQYEFSAASGDAVAPDDAARGQILCALAPRISAPLIAAMPKLEWLQALTTGVDNLLAMDALELDVVLTNARGIHGPQMSELAIMLMMASIRRFPEMAANQASGSWKRWPQPLLFEKTVCIVGLGVIATALAERCNAFGMRVTGVSDGRSEAPGFARVYPRRDLAEAAADADFLVVVVPYAPETHHLVNGAVLDAMKSTAILVNISRGGCVDEDALVERLRSGRIAGVALDVFATEPLPPDSPFWSLPNVIVTPHIGGMSDIYARQVFSIVSDNLAAYAAGGAAALKNRVDRGR